MQKNHIPDKVLLLTPPSIFLLDERVFPNLGILKVAAVLEREGVHVDHLDLSGIENSVDLLSDYLKTNRDIKHVGITSTTPQLPAVTSIVAELRKLRPDMKIILGGPHATITWAAVKQEKRAGVSSRAHRAFDRMHEVADVIVAGDGEFAVLESLRPDAPFVIDADDPKGSLFMTNEMYADTPEAARHLIDMESYKYTIEGHSSTSLIAQLGCPFQCGFCGGRNSPMLRRIRTRSIESIIRELEFLHKNYGYTGFMFYDDEINVNKQMIDLMESFDGINCRFTEAPWCGVSASCLC